MSQAANTPGRRARAVERGFRVTTEVDARYPAGRTRRRYVGRARRGAPSSAALDTFAARIALDELKGALEILARIDANAELTKAETIALHLEARGKIALAGRCCDEITLKCTPTWPDRRAA